MESRSIVHTRMLRHRVGIVNIEFDSIDMHVALRRPNTPHVAALQRSLSDDCSARWAQPIDVVVGPHVSLAWLDNLRDIRIGTATPLGSRFICIGGQHRLLAGRRFVEEWMAEHENESVPPQLSSWPATVYEQGEIGYSFQFSSHSFSCTQRLGAGSLDDGEKSCSHLAARHPL